VSYVKMSDLSGPHGGHHGGGRWGRGWRGGSWWGGYYPPLWYWDVAPVVVSPVQPDFSEEDAASAESQGESEDGMGRLYVDAGPGAFDAFEADRVAREDELLDEAVPAQQAFLARKALGLGEVTAAQVSDVEAKQRGSKLVTAGAVLAGAVAGAFVGSMLYNRLAGARPAVA